LGDALDDCQPEAHACVVGADAFIAAKKWLGKRGHHLRRERLAGVLDQSAGADRPPPAWSWGKGKAATRR
jgi:hypothetical protein